MVSRGAKINALVSEPQECNSPPRFPSPKGTLYCPQGFCDSESVRGTPFKGSNTPNPKMEGKPRGNLLRCVNPGCPIPGGSV